jgi:hypothetical protein
MTAPFDSTLLNLGVACGIDVENPPTASARDRGQCVVP